MGGRWPHLQKAQREPRQDHLGRNSQDSFRSRREAPAKLRVDPVITRWQHEEVEMILRVWEARESGRSACSL